MCLYRLTPLVRQKNIGYDCRTLKTVMLNQFNIFYNGRSTNAPSLDIQPIILCLRIRIVTEMGIGIIICMGPKNVHVIQNLAFQGVWKDF